MKVYATAQSTCFGDSTDENDCLLKIEVKAAKCDNFKVNTLNLILALDVSQSMHGRKLDHAIETLCAVVRTLKQNAVTNDIKHYFTLFGFDDTIHSYNLENQEIGVDTDIERIIYQVMRIGSEGATNIERAFVHAFDILEKQDDNVVNDCDTVIALLSDGSSNKGIRNGSEMAREIQRMRSKHEKPIKLSIIGYGNDYSADFCHSLIESDVNDEIFHVDPYSSSHTLCDATGGILGGAIATVVKNLKIRICSENNNLIQLDDVFGANGNGKNCLVFGHLEMGQTKNVVVCLKKEKEKDITINVSYMCKTDNGMTKVNQSIMVKNVVEKDEDITRSFFVNKSAQLKKKCLDVVFSNEIAFKEVFEILKTFLSDMKNDVDEDTWKNVKKDVEEIDKTFLDGQKSYANTSRNNLLRATSLRMTRQNGDSVLRRAFSNNIANFMGVSNSNSPNESVQMQENAFELPQFTVSYNNAGLTRSLSLPQ